MGQLIVVHTGSSGSYWLPNHLGHLTTLDWMKTPVDEVLGCYSFGDEDPADSPL